MNEMVFYFGSSKLLKPLTLSAQCLEKFKADVCGMSDILYMEVKRCSGWVEALSTRRLPD